MIHAFISLSVVGLLPALAVLAIVEELSLIAVLDFFFFIFALEFTLAAGSTENEIAADHCSRLRKGLSTLAVWLAVDEAALILVTIRPSNLTLAIWLKLLLVLSCVLAALTSVD